MNTTTYNQHPLNSNLDLNAENGFFGTAPQNEPDVSQSVPENIPTSYPVKPAEEELSDLSQAMMDDDSTFVDANGSIHVKISGEATPQNAVEISDTTFGAPSAQEEELARLAQALQDDDGDGYYVDEFGRIRLGSEPTAGVNMTKVDGNIFGAHEDQWYRKNPQLMNAEIAVMRKHYPKAGFDFWKVNGNMYWLVTLKVFQTPGITKPWVFQLTYDKDHPNNHGFGGSIKVVPLKPSLDDLKKIAKDHKRPGVPHVIHNESHFLKHYLCTRWPKDIESGDELVSSATQAAAWAADWAAHFELGIRNAKVWNKWCDDDHFRWMQIPE